MIKIAAFVVVGLILAVLTLAAARPSAFHVERSIEVRAAPEKIFPLINDFHRWGEWSPWEKIDPGMERSFSGAANGPGAVYEWEGNRDIGQGRMEILTAAPSKVVIDLHFIKPFEGRNTATFTLAPQQESTQVTWAMDGNNAFIAKVIGLFIDMDKMIGDNFETGLANLKSLAEA